MAQISRPFDPKQLIIAHLSNPYKGLSQQQLQTRRALQKAGRMDDSSADPSTIIFLKECTIPRHHLYAIKYKNIGGEQRYAFCHIMQDAQNNWFIEHISTGSLLSVERSFQATSQTPASSSLIQFVGMGSNPFWLEGLRSNRAPQAKYIRLISGTNQIIDEPVQDDLFICLIGKSFAPPIEIEIYNNASTLLEKHSLDFYFPNTTP